MVYPEKSSPIRVNWLLLATGASILWGLTYVIQEKLFSSISVTSYLIIVSFFTFFCLIIVGSVEKKIVPDIKTILASKELIVWTVLAVVIYILAELCIGYSIERKNATLAGLIEITYPAFIVIFSVLLLKENHFSLGVIVGGSFIFLGATIVSVFGR